LKRRIDKLLQPSFWHDSFRRVKYIILLSLFLNLKSHIALSKVNYFTSFELLGIGGLYSLNFGIRTPLLHKLSFESGLGVSSVVLKDINNRFNPQFSLPQRNIILYGNKHKVYAGCGVNLFSTTKYNFDISVIKRVFLVELSVILGYEVGIGRNANVYIQYNPILFAAIPKYFYGALGFKYRF
jgi:hypothetical protein